MVVLIILKHINYMYDTYTDKKQCLPILIHTLHYTYTHAHHTVKY